MVIFVAGSNVTAPTRPHRRASRGQGWTPAVAWLAVIATLLAALLLPLIAEHLAAVPRAAATATAIMATTTPQIPIP